MLACGSVAPEPYPAVPCLAVPCLAFPCRLGSRGRRTFLCDWGLRQVSSSKTRAPPYDPSSPPRGYRKGERKVPPVGAFLVSVLKNVTERRHEGIEGSTLAYLY